MKLGGESDETVFRDFIGMGRIVREGFHVHSVFGAQWSGQRNRVTICHMSVLSHRHNKLLGTGLAPDTG